MKQARTVTPKLSLLRTKQTSGIFQVLHLKVLPHSLFHTRAWKYLKYLLFQIKQVIRKMQQFWINIIRFKSLHSFFLVHVLSLSY